jgi:hypothetical protein
MAKIPIANSAPIEIVQNIYHDIKKTIWFQQKMLVKIVYMLPVPFWGLGDYLRGVFTTIGLCEEQAVSWELEYRYHTIHRWLTNAHVTADEFTQKDVSIFHVQDGKTLVSSFPQLKNLDGVFYMSTNAWYLPRGIQETSRLRLVESLQPNTELQQGIESTLSSLGIQKGAFAAVHIRMGDSYLLHGKIDETQFEKARQAVKELLKGESRPVVVFSDCAAMKRYLAEKEGFLQSPSTPCHLSAENDEKAVFETLVDFFVLGQSAHIYQYSKYGHGTGFSDWCSEMFHIPITRCPFEP